MKTITIDYKMYQKELDEARYHGFRQGLGSARRVFLEILAGASFENLPIEEEEFSMECGDVRTLAEDVLPRVRDLRRGGGAK